MKHNPVMIIQLKITQIILEMILTKKWTPKDIKGIVKKFQQMGILEHFDQIFCQNQCWRSQIQISS